MATQLSTELHKISDVNVVNHAPLPEVISTSVHYFSVPTLITKPCSIDEVTVAIYVSTWGKWQTLKYENTEKSYLLMFSASRIDS